MASQTIWNLLVLEDSSGFEDPKILTVGQKLGDFLLGVFGKQQTAGELISNTEGLAPFQQFKHTGEL
jgi:hypothetical protein